MVFSHQFANWRSGCLHSTLHLEVGEARAEVYCKLNSPTAMSISLTSNQVRQQIKQLDPWGNLFFMPGITCLLLALQWGGTTYAWGNVSSVDYISYVLLINASGTNNRSVRPRWHLSVSVHLYSIPRRRERHNSSTHPETTLHDSRYNLTIRPLGCHDHFRLLHPDLVPSHQRC